MGPNGIEGDHIIDLSPPSPNYITGGGGGSII